MNDFVTRSSDEVWLRAGDTRLVDGVMPFPKVLWFHSEASAQEAHRGEIGMRGRVAS